MRIFSILLTLAFGLAAVSTARAERCGTWHLTGDAGASAAPAARPAPGTFQIPSAHFIIHYNDAALDAYAQETRDAAERAWRVLVDTLAYNAPLSDGTLGGDARVDIYLGDLGSVWGVTTPETFVGAPYPGSWTAYMEVSDVLPLERLRVVTAHEFFHAVQVGYDRSEASSYLEMISTWAEDRVYDDIDLYLEVLPNFFIQPQKALYSYVYSNVPWAIFLTERYGDAVLLDIMEECGAVAGINVTAAVNAALAPRGSSQIDAFTEFTLWNYFTGARDDGAHYSEGATFPLVSVERRFDCYPSPAYATAHKMGRLGANYFVFDGNGADDALRLRVNPEYYATSVFTVHRFKDGAITTESFSTPPAAGADSLTLSDWGECDSVIVVCHIESTTQSFNSVTVASEVIPAPSPIEPYVLLLDRDACRTPFDGVGDEFAARDGEEAPIAAALSVHGFRVLQTDSVPPDLSACGGVFVVGGHDGTATTLGDAELETLTAFVLGGGDIYVEGNELGRFIDPSLGAGSAAANAFWNLFGCDFTPGDPAATGNVASWSTRAPLPAMGFDYDYRGEPDDRVGVLTPTSADSLAVDQDGTPRMTLLAVAGSTRIMSTLLLGGSTGQAVTRADFIGEVVDLFDSIVAALSALRFDVRRDGARVLVEGEVSGYGGETLTLRRAAAGRASVVPLTVTEGAGETARFRAVDDDPAPGAEYRLEATDRLGRTWMLAARTLEAGVPARPLSIAAVYPSPSAGPVSVVIESDAATEARIGIYNVAGQRVAAFRRTVTAGSTTVVIDDAAGLGSGVYFVRVEARGHVARHKLHILR